MRRTADLARGRGAGLAESLDAANVPRLCAGKQYPVAAEPQRLPLRARRYPRSEGRTAAVARSLGDTGLHELPLVERRRQQQLHRHLRNQRRADALRRRQTAHGGQGTEAPKPHRRTLGHRIRERHPHRHRRSLHAGALRRRSRGGSRRYGRSLARPARPRRADVAGGIDQQGRFRPARKPVCERPLPSSRRPVVARRLQVAAQTAARTRHHGGDESCRARRGRRDRLAGPARQNRHLRDGARRHAADRKGAAGRRDGGVGAQDSIPPFRLRPASARDT